MAVMLNWPAYDMAPTPAEGKTPSEARRAIKRKISGHRRCLVVARGRGMPVGRPGAGDVPLPGQRHAQDRGRSRPGVRVTGVDRDPARRRDTLALYRRGRQADALAAYQRARRTW